ncbi:V-set and immunoglobulin domain containing 8b precursor, partial [Triplophysa rosa]
NNMLKTRYKGQINEVKYRNLFALYTGRALISSTLDFKAPITGNRRKIIDFHKTKTPSKARSFTFQSKRDMRNELLYPTHNLCFRLLREESTRLNRHNYMTRVIIIPSVITSQTGEKYNVDAAPPDSRPGSRTTSFRSMRSYHAHPGLRYTSVRQADVMRAESGRSAYTERSGVQREASMLASDDRRPLPYDSKYGYPV